MESVRKIEAIKQNTILYSIELDKKKLSEFLIQDIIKVDKSFANIPILTDDIIDRSSLKELKQFLDLNKSKLKDGLFDYCMEEYREIKEDLIFRNSKEGKLIIELENWVLSARKAAIQKLRIENLFIGRSMFDPKEVVIGCELPKNINAQEIEDFFNKLNPPTTIQYHLEKSLD